MIYIIKYESNMDGKVDMTLQEFFKSIGFNITNLISDLKSISLYLSWYQGTVESFHQYYVFNGDKKICRTRYSIGLPKKICENFADLIMNTKTTISLSNDGSTQKLMDILDRNDFWQKANQGIEKSFALGFGAFLVSIDKEFGIKIQYIDATNIIPLTFDQFKVKECAFVSDSIDNDGSHIKYVQTHTLDEYGDYIIQNYKFSVGASGDLTLEESDDIAETVYTNSKIPWFSILKPNIVNNISLDSPFGLPIYANSLDIIKSADIIYDSFINEIQNGRKRLFVTADALKVNSNGKFGPAFDPNDVVFYLLEGNLENDKKYVQEINGELRIQELTTAIKTNLEILSMKLGLGEDYWRLDSNYFARTKKTATEVVASNSDLIRTIHKHEISVESCLRNLIMSIQEISKNYFSESIEGDIFIDFDDSVIESDSELREQDRKDVEIGVMPLSEYRSKWYGEDVELAQEMVNLAQKEGGIKWQTINQSTPGKK